MLIHIPTHKAGIGNGTSIIITVNIISSLPGALVQAWHFFVTGKGVSPVNSIMMVVMIVLLLVVIAATIAITQAQRRIAKPAVLERGPGLPAPLPGLETWPIRNR